MLDPILYCTLQLNQSIIFNEIIQTIAKQNKKPRQPQPQTRPTNPTQQSNASVTHI